MSDQRFLFSHGTEHKEEEKQEEDDSVKTIVLVSEELQRFNIGMTERFFEEQSSLSAMDPKFNRFDYLKCEKCPEDHACCNDLIAITAWESLPIAQFLVNHRPDLIERVETRAKEIVDFGFVIQENPGDIDKAAEQWAESKTPCIFHENNKCAIYDIRPFRCQFAFPDPDGKKSCVKDGCTIADSTGLTKMRMEHVIFPSNRKSGSLVTSDDTVLTDKFDEMNKMVSRAIGVFNNNGTIGLSLKMHAIIQMRVNTPDCPDDCDCKKGQA